MEQQRTHVLDWLERFNRIPYEGHPLPPRWLSSAKHRETPGESVNRGGGKLTPSLVRDIKSGLAAEHTTSSLARKYGVSKTAISNIAMGKTWTDVKL